MKVTSDSFFGQRHLVILNDKVLYNCFEADNIEGYADVYLLNKTIFDKLITEIPVKRLYGRIGFRRIDNA